MNETDLVATDKAFSVIFNGTDNSTFSDEAHTLSYDESYITETLNSTPKGVASVEISKPVLGIVAALTFTIGLVGTVGNLLAVVSLLSSNRLRVRPSTYFVVSLPLSLLPVCLIGMPYYGIISLQVLLYNRILMPSIASMTISVICFIFSEVHIHTICALALNRTLAVCQPAFYRRVMSSRRHVYSYLIILWLYSILVWLPITCLGFLEVNEKELMVSLKPDTNRIIRILHVLWSLIIPIFFTTTCYSIMFHKVRQSKVTDNSNVMRQWDHHVTKTIKVIFVVLVVCSVPHLVMHALQIYQEHIHAWLLLHLLFWVQFCIDPFIYVAYSSEYRQACLQFLARRFPQMECLQKKIRGVEYGAANNPEPTVILPTRVRKTSVVFASNATLLTNKRIARQKSRESNKSFSRQASRESNKSFSRQASQETNKSLPRIESQVESHDVSMSIKQEEDS